MKRQELILTAGLLLCFSLSGPLRADTFTGTVSPGSPASFFSPPKLATNSTLLSTPRRPARLPSSNFLIPRLTSLLLQEETGRMENHHSSTGL